MKIEEKVSLLLKHSIALWDVLKSCDIEGAADSSIKNSRANDFDVIFSAADIRAVFATGKTALSLYKKHTGRDAEYLPSSSPANCAVSFEKLVREYSKILKYLK